MPSFWRINLRLPKSRRRLPLPLLALCAAIAGQVVLGQGLMLAGGIMLATGALLIAVASATVGPAPPDSATTPPPADETGAQAATGPDLLGGWWGFAGLLLVTVVAAAFRLPLLGALPPGLAADEARLGLDAVSILTGESAGSPWAGWPIFHLLTVGSVAVLGQIPLAVRWPAALAGICFAPALFLLGRQLGGGRLGILAGLLGAMVFWHADTTRGAWGYLAWGVTCEALGVALLLHAARRRDSTSAALAGVALGLALQVSWSALGALAVAVAMVARTHNGLGAGRLPVRSVLEPFLVYAAIAAGPVIIGLTGPDRQPTGSAISETVHTQNGRSLADTSALQTVGRLALMFNVAGDPNPLHNLRGAPHLNIVMAALLVLGIGLALGRWRSAVGWPLLAWLAVSLGFGALNARQQPPDSLAAFHAIIPALLLAAGGLVAGCGHGNSDTPKSPVWRLDLTLALLGIIAAIDAHALFVRRPADTASWTAYASAETLAVPQINRLIPTHAIYLADVWFDHPTIRFLAVDLESPRRLDAATTLPLREDEAFAYFAPGHQEVVTEDLERLYEDGEIDRYPSPLDSSVVMLRTFRARAKVVAEARGVTVRATTQDRSRTYRFTLPAFDFEWPLPGETGRAATLDVFAAVTVDTAGPHRFQLDGSSEATLEVNDVPLGRAGDAMVAPLAVGTQRIRVTAPADRTTRIRLRWAPPGSREMAPIPPDRLYREQRAVSGLLATYRSGLDPTAKPEVVRMERYIQREGNPPVLDRPYVVDLVGVLDAPKSGTYRFKLTGSGPVSMWLDDQVVVLDPGPTDEPASMVLAEGDHRIRLQMVDVQGPTGLDLWWAPPGEQFGAIPTSRYSPPAGAVDAVAAQNPDREGGVPPLGTPRIRWLASTEGEPRGVAVTTEGAVYLTNVTSRDVQRIVGSGEAVESLPDTAVGIPADVEVGPDGAIWLLDARDAQIRRIDPATGTVTKVGGSDLGLYRPRGFALAPDGTILVADTGGSRVMRLASDGTALDRIGPNVGGPVRLRQPTDVAVGSDGQLYVVNGEGGDVLRLAADGTYLNHWSVLSADTERGAHIAVGPDSAVWISEPDGRRIRRFTRDGVPAGVIDQTQEGRLLRSPVGIAVGSDGTLYVADVSLRAILAIRFQR